MQFLRHTHYLLVLMKCIHAIQEMSDLKNQWTHLFLPHLYLFLVPPPTRQIITDQSLCLLRHEIKNSGSEKEKSGFFFFSS